MHGIQMSLLLTLFSGYYHSIIKLPTIEKTADFWIENGKLQIKSKMIQKDITTKARNIILFIGDGMGISTVTTTRIYKNQRTVPRQMADENLVFEELHNIGLSKTYCADNSVCDSAATATAILTGVKTNRGTLGLSSRINSKNCKTYNGQVDDLKNIADYFFANNKSLGIVTTASITGATPAAVYANIYNRHLKHKSSKNCPFKDIASQLISKSEMFQVIFGGGRTSFLLGSDNDPEYEDEKGSRKDCNLINKWERKMMNRSAKYIWNGEQFRGLQAGVVDHVFGLFEPDDMLYSDEDNDDPKLFEMTVKAIEMLSRNRNGFFLLVEEGKIDKAHHANLAFRAILQTLELEKAVKKALEMTDPNETLIIVTADHSHVMTLGGSMSRDSNIMGFSGIAKDKRGFSSILYSNGPNFHSPRENITRHTNFTANTQYHAGVHMKSESHGGEEVTVYSQGPWSHLLRNVFEQSFIGHVMMYSSCTGIYIERDGCLSNTSSELSISLMLLLCFCVVNFIKL